MTEEECEFATELHESILLQCIRWIHVFVLLTAISLVIYTGFRLLSLTIFDRVTLASHIIAREIAPTPCVAQIPKPLCIFRMGAAAVTPAFVLIHASLTVHQALATFGCSPLVQRAQAIVAMLLTLGYAVLFGIFSFDEETLTGKVQLCPFFNEKGEVFIIANLNAMMALDIVNFVTAQLLLKHNKKILAKERGDYELKRTFRRVQNLKAMEQFIPMHALHSISHLAHFGLYSFFYYCRPNYSEAEFIITFAVANVMPYYCLLSPLAFLILTKLGRFRRQDDVRVLISQKSNETDTYFKDLRAAWN